MTDASKDPSLEEFLGESQNKRMPRWVKWAVIAVVILLAIVLMRTFFFRHATTGYATLPVKRGDMVVHVTATGNLKPTNEITVGSEISGLILKVNVDANDHVTKGEALAQIDPQKLIDAINRSKASLNSAKASVQQAEATAAQNKAQLDRDEEVSRVSGGKVPSKTELDQARADYSRAQANVAVAKANVDSAAAQLSTDNTNLEKATIRSPVDGVVLSRQVETGQTVAASFNTPTLFDIAQDLKEMELEVKVDEADVGQVHQGQTASFTVDAYPGKTFPASIKRVNVGSNSSSATSASTSSNGVVSYVALLQVKPDLTLRPGMTATATIITSEEKNVLLVPNAALRFEPGKSARSPQPQASVLPVGRPIFRRGGGSQQEVTFGRGSHRTVYTLEADGKLTPHEVSTGSTNGSDTIVTSKTLKPGMNVVTGELAAQK